MKSLLILLFCTDLFLQEYFRKHGWGLANTGVSFGLRVGEDRWLVALLVLMVLLVWQRINRKHLGVEFWLVFWGGLGNLTQRLTHGHVWDYLPFWGGLWFNLSDVLIVVGALISIMRDNSQNGKNKIVEG